MILLASFVLLFAIIIFGIVIGQPVMGMFGGLVMLMFIGLQTGQALLLAFSVLILIGVGLRVAQQGYDVMNGRAN